MSKTGELVWVDHPTGYRPQARSGMLVREITVAPADLTTLGGLPITTVLRTAFDCARWLSLVEALVVADFFAHAGFLSSVELSSYARAHRGLRGCRQVARVIELMDAKTESPMETRLRLLLVQAGLTGFFSQFEIFGAAGGFVARVDFPFVAERVIVEYDGAHHREQRRDDDRRRTRSEHLAGPSSW